MICLIQSDCSVGLRSDCNSVMLLMLLAFLMFSISFYGEDGGIRREVEGFIYAFDYLPCDGLLYQEGCKPNSLGSV